MSEISATIGAEQLKHLDEWIDKRRHVARLYDELLDDKVIKPKELEKRKHAYHLYVIRTKKRDALKEFLHENEIGTGIHYPTPIHKQPIFSGRRSLPATERICEEILSLPMHPTLKDEEVEYVCKKVNEFLSDA